MNRQRTSRQMAIRAGANVGDLPGRPEGYSTTLGAETWMVPGEYNAEPTDTQLARVQQPAPVTSSNGKFKLMPLKGR